MKIEVDIFTKFKNVDSVINDYSKEKCFVTYFKRNQIPDYLDKNENLIIEGEGALIFSLLKKYIDSGFIEPKPHDFGSDIYINGCVIYPQSEDLIEKDDEEDS